MRRDRLVVNAIGGLCNRMRAIAAGLRLAGMSGRCTEVVWQNNSDLAADFTDLFLPLPNGVRIIHPGKAEYSLKWEMPRRRNLYASAIYQRTAFSNVFSDQSGLQPYFDDNEGFEKKILYLRGNIL